MIRRSLVSFLFLFFATAAVAQQPDPGVRAYAYLPAAVVPGLPFTFTVQYANVLDTPAVNSLLQVDAPPGSHFLQVPNDCGNEVTVALCRFASLRPWSPGSTYQSLQFTVSAPDLSAQSFDVGVIIDAQEPRGTFVSSASSRTFRTFFVDNTGDSGPGSLRDAIVAANTACTADPLCKIAFRIPESGAAWHTIRPLSPLPPLAATGISLDGATQERYVADTNASGPDIEISGELQNGGDGITITAPAFEVVRGLAVNGFASGSGIAVVAQEPGPSLERVPAKLITGICAGTDPTGTTARPNMRGLTLETVMSNVTIEDNIVSGNLRSGIFIEQGFAAVVRNNRIGLSSALAQPLGNGASGIYIAPRGTATDVNDNYIGFNAHFGVAMAPGASRVGLSGNSFQANHQLAIDYGMDGVTSAIPEAFEGEPASGAVIAIPEITSARYDATSDTTIIEGTAPTASSRQTVFVALYANDAPDPSGFGEGQYFLGTVEASPAGAFRFAHHGPLPGPWVAATATRRTIIGFARGPRIEGISGGGYTWTTTEFSRTVKAD